MSKMTNLAKEIRKSLSESDKKKPRSYDTEAIVSSVDENVLWVKLPGSETETPVRKTIDAKIGDTIMVRVANHKAWTIGNETNPPTDDSLANNAYNIASGARKDISALNNIVVENIEATNAKFVNVEADTAKIHDLTADQLSASVAYIDELQAGNISASNIVADHADVGTLKVTKADIADLNAANAEITNLKSSKADIVDLNAANAKITNLESTKADISVLEAGYAKIDLANVNNAYIKNGVFDTAAIVDEQVFTVTGNKATITEINADEINVRNLNAKNLTIETADGYIQLGDKKTPTKEFIDSLTNELNDRIDGAIETYTATAVPTLSNYPASSWTTDDEKATHVGDVCYVVNDKIAQNGYCYRFTLNGTTFSWQLIKDSDVTAALQRLQTAEGKIGNIETFDEEIASFKTNTESELSSLKTKTTNLETSLGDKVDNTTFNEVKQTVDENSASISTLSTTVSKKADGSTVTTLSNTVNAVKQTSDQNKSDISSLTQTVSDNKDELDGKYSSVSQDLSSFKTTVGETYTKLETFNNYKETNDATVADVKTTADNTASELDTVKTTYVTKTSWEAKNDEIAGSISDVETTTKSYTDGKISTEVSDRNSAINAKADAILTTVSETYYTRDDASTLAGRVSANETAISQKASSIELSTVKSTAESKAKVFTSQPKPPYSVGDVWAQGPNGDIYKCKTARTSGNYTASDWEIASKYTDDTKANSVANDLANNYYDKASFTVSSGDSKTPAEIVSEVISLQDGKTISSRINQTANNVKIQADKVNIEGATIFTGSGRLSQTSLDNAYDAKNAASDAVSALTTDLASSTGTTVIDGGHITTNSITIGQVASLQSSLDGKATPANVATAKSEAISAAATDATNKANNAAKTATSYITDIDSNKGITLKPADSTGSDYLMMNSNAIAFYRNSSTNSCVNLTDDTFRIGLLASGHSTVKSDGLHVWTGAESTATNEVAKFGAESRIGSIEEYKARLELSSGVMKIILRSRDGVDIDFATIAFGATEQGNYPYFTFGRRDDGSSIGMYSFSEGDGNTASGMYSHAEGSGSTASMSMSHAEGYNTTAKASAAHAQNEGTIAAGGAQTAMGSYNVEDTTSLLIIGNGTSNSARSNALRVLKNGDMQLSGKISVAGHSSAIGTVKDAYLSAAKSIANSTSTSLCSFSLEAGVWLVHAWVRFPSNATGSRVANIAASGAADWQASMAAVNGNVSQLHFTRILAPTSATTYHLNAIQTSGAAMTMAAGAANGFNAMRAVRIA